MSARSNLVLTLALSVTLLLANSERAVGADAKQHIDLKSGLRMAYRVAGPETGPPLILLHGLGDTSRSWTLMTTELAKHNRLYMLDQRGHGDTQAPACCYALADFGYDVITFMDAMKIESAAIAGHSLGSFVAQHLAAAYPSRVRALVLLGSADATMGNDVIEWLWSQSLTFGANPPSAFVDEWQSNPTPVDPEFLAKVKTETAAVPVHVWKSVARTLLVEDHRRFLGECKTPTLILWGEKDPVFPTACQERLQQVMPHAIFQAYPNVGHNLHWEVPGEIAQEIETFVREKKSAR